MGFVWKVGFFFCGVRLCLRFVFVSELFELVSKERGWGFMEGFGGGLVKGL